MNLVIYFVVYFCCVILLNRLVLAHEYYLPKDYNRKGSFISKIRVK